MSKLRWGVIGAGRIANTFARDIGLADDRAAGGKPGVSTADGPGQGGFLARILHEG